jgi:hypothetical protein
MDYQQMPAARPQAYWAINVMINRRKLISTLLGTGLMVTLGGCAANNQSDDVYHGFALEVGKSAGHVINIRYSYGNELPDESRPSAKANGSFITHFAPMQIPEEFKIAWETQDGQKHEAKVPVRSRLSSSVKNNKILFVIMYNSIEGYISTSTPYGPKLERFY